MKQIIQNYKTGELKVEKVGYPSLKKNACIIKTKNSLISAGTERTKIETAQMNLIEKAFSRLDLVKILFNNIKQEGLVFTLKKAFNKLNTPITLGYSLSGEIEEVDENIADFKKGDRVACIGEVYASHAEYNLVPKDWFIKIPDSVNDIEASFVGLGAIAYNSVHLTQVKKNEKIVVIGLGLLGQIVIQILKALGAEVLGVEIDDSKIKLAKSFGIDECVNPMKGDVIAGVNAFTNNFGADAVIITAASKNNFPIELSGKISRNKGRVILVGAMPIIIPREEFYKKELNFVISRGFGADIYYKENSRDYSYNYTAKTMMENMTDFLHLIGEKKVNVASLVSHRFDISDAEKAYKMIESGKEKYLAIIFDYLGESSSKDKETKMDLTNSKFSGGKKEPKVLNIGFVGAGSFAQGYILPVLKSRKDVNLVGLATASGISAASSAKKFGFEYATTDYKKLLQDDKIDTIFITTRHNTHAKFLIEALENGKNVYVEKPLCLNSDELEKIKKVYREKNKILMVGFNRRFSPFIQKAKDFLQNRVGPIMLTYRVNAGFLPLEHWLHNEEGGGRILGEGCHFIDLANFLIESRYSNLQTVLSAKTEKTSDENFNITITYEDGSIANIQYSSVGDTSFSRERLEMFCDNSAVVIDNYKKAEYSKNGIVKKLTKLERDMGHTNEINFFIDKLKNNESLINFDELVLTHEMLFQTCDRQT